MTVHRCPYIALVLALDDRLPTLVAEVPVKLRSESGRGVSEGLDIRVTSRNATLHARS